MWDSIKKLLSSLGLSGAGSGSNGSSAGGGVSQRGDDADAAEMMGCHEALERLFEFLDEELDPATHRQVAAHLEVCRRCYPRLQFERAFMETLRRTRAGQKTPTHMKQKVMDLLAQEGLEIA